MIKYFPLTAGILLWIFQVTLWSATPGDAWTPSPRYARSHTMGRPTTTILYAQSSSSSNNNNNNKKSKGLDAGLRSKLISESIAPWRTVRLFLYGSMGSGALLGGIINLTGLLAAVSKQQEYSLNTELLNLAIDFGAVTAFVLLFRWDLGKQQELNSKVTEKIERKKEQRKLLQGMKEREKELASLKLNIQISVDGNTREAAFRELQAGAKQHVILVAGPKKACRDALIGANLLKMDFAMSNVLVVPYETDSPLLEETPQGFGDRPSYETQPYVARPTGEGWKEFIQAEMSSAVEQNGDSARDEGIALVVANNGKIIRRGVGKVPWRQMVEQLQEAVKV